MSRFKSKYESAARALYEAARPLDGWDKMSESVKRTFRNYAKAAIAAHEAAGKDQSLVTSTLQGK